MSAAERSAILALIPGQPSLSPGQGSRHIHSAVSLYCVMHDSKDWGNCLGGVFLGWETGFKAVRGGAWMPRRALVLGHRRMGVRQLLALAACCVLAGGLLWDPAGPCWKEASTAFPFSGPWGSFWCCGASPLCPEEVFTHGRRIEFI